MRQAAESSLEAVRLRVLAEHLAIRRVLRSIEDHARAVADGAEGADDAGLRDRLSAFEGIFLEHLAMEETELAPLLRDVDPWGPVRVERMLEEHVQQRRQVGALMTARDEPSVRRLAASSLRLVARIRKDMREEERDLQALRADGFDAAPISS